MTCEKCWADAYVRALSSGRSQAEHYCELLKERVGAECSSREQAGQFWDEEHQMDERVWTAQEIPR